MKNNEDKALASRALLSQECDCNTWCDNDLRYRLLTGHHQRCTNAAPILDKAIELIAELAKGMECWASDEDGIHPDAWEAYQKAKILQGDFSVLQKVEF